jgi:hypothetical protein
MPRYRRERTSAFGVVTVRAGRVRVIAAGILGSMEDAVLKGTARGKAGEEDADVDFKSGPVADWGIVPSYVLRVGELDQ